MSATTKLAEPIGENSIELLLGVMKLAKDTKKNYVFRIREYLRHVNKTADQFVEEMTKSFSTATPPEPMAASSRPMIMLYSCLHRRMKSTS